MSRIQEAKKRIEARAQHLQHVCFEDRYTRPPLYPVEEVRMDDWLAEREATVASAGSCVWTHTLD